MRFSIFLAVAVIAIAFLNVEQVSAAASNESVLKKRSLPIKKLGTSYRKRQASPADGQPPPPPPPPCPNPKNPQCPPPPPQPPACPDPKNPQCPQTAKPIALSLPVVTPPAVPVPAAPPVGAIKFPSVPSLDTKSMPDINTYLSALQGLGLTGAKGTKDED